MHARELIYSLPERLKADSGKGISLIYHFRISGENGGDFTFELDNGKAAVKNGLIGDPKCVVEAKDTDYEDVEYGRTNAQMAVLFGKIKVSNIGSMLKFVEMFEKVSG